MSILQAFEEDPQRVRLDCSTLIKALNGQIEHCATCVSARDLLQANLCRRLQADGVGGAYRDRTDDPLLAKQVLSQLS